MDMGAEQSQTTQNTEEELVEQMQELKLEEVKVPPKKKKRKNTNQSDSNKRQSLRLMMKEQKKKSNQDFVVSFGKTNTTGYCYDEEMVLH